MLPITVTEYKELISKARKLKSQIDKNKLDTNVVKNFIEFTLNTSGKNFDTNILTKEDITKMFKEYLEKECQHILKSGKYEHYWDYHEDIQSSDLEKILELANKEKAENFTQATNWYLFEKYPEIESEDIGYIINDFYKQNSEKVDEIKDVLDWEDYYFLSEIFYENIEYDLDVETLLRHSAPEDLTVYFGQTWDDEYGDIEYDFVQSFDEPEFLTNERDTPIDWLMTTQGYTREDLVSKEKRENSKFLKSLYEELFHYMNGLEGCQLIAIPRSDDFEAILNLSRRKNVKINKSTYFGFFNQVHGSGCGLSIELEKDIIIDENSPVYNVKMTYHNEFGNYSPDAVYGLALSRYRDDLEVIKDKEEEN